MTVSSRTATSDAHFATRATQWTHAIQVLAGSTLMPGAADLVVRGAFGSRRSMIRLSSRGDVAHW